MRLAKYLVALISITGVSLAAPPDRITRPVNSTQIRSLSGQVERFVQPELDRGPLDPGTSIQYVLLVVRPSQAQQAELDLLLADQQNPTSAHYHQWLSPEEYGNRFGLSSSDHSKVVAWLTAEGLTVNDGGRGRNWIAFSGTAARMSNALHTPFHQFEVNGARHFANTANPAVPEALADVVDGFIGLNDLPPTSMIQPVTPEYNSGASHYLAPQDLATIYNLTPIYQAGIDGTGQSIAVVGQSDVSLTDLRNFRTRFGLPANDPKMLLYGGSDPGYTSAETEGDLDLEWAGAIASKATIWYVYGASAFTAMTTAISQNIAPIITVSYGGCEIGYRLNYWRSIAQQANAQGITILNSSGDSGGAGCDPHGSNQYAVAGRTVSFPANLPEVTGVGGTQFTEGSGTYWASTNSATTLASALSYIPEAAWNESGSSGLISTGGGASQLYGKPAWQNAPGVPADNARDVPDISLSAALHDAYSIVYEGGNYVVGGTSASAPAMAGIVALLSQYLINKGTLKQPGLGNINPQLYRLAQDAPSVFHDVIAGDNIVKCAQGSPDCDSGAYGYAATPGYDLATGLGSVDANNLITQWNTDTKAVSVGLFINTARATLNDTVGMTATVVPLGGSGVPTGTVSFSANGIKLGVATLRDVGGYQEADLFFPAYIMSGTGATTVFAQYSGDNAFSGGGAGKSLTIIAPVGVASIMPTAPDTVWPAPDAQGLGWQMSLNLREYAGVAVIVTSFAIDGVAQSLAQYLPTTEIPPAGTLTANIVMRNIATPSVHTFTVGGVDANGNSWSRSVSVNFLGLPPGNAPVVSATPLVINQNPSADPACQWSTQVNVDEAGANVGLQETALSIGGVSLTAQIPAFFGTVRLAPWAGLQGSVCLGGSITPPATETIRITTSGVEQDLVVSLMGPVPNAATIHALPGSVSMSAPVGQTAQATLFLQLSDPAAPWTATFFPANRTTAWLKLSRFAGVGSATIALNASAAGFGPGAYRANLTIQSPNASPQTVTVPILFVIGPAGADSAIQMVANSASYTSAVSPGMVVAVFGSNLAGDTGVAAGNPLPYTLAGVTAAVNGIAAPLVYVSPTQINLQIPYEVGAGPAVLGINHNGQVTGYAFAVSAAAPGILTDGSGNLSPNATVTAGGSTTLYFTGAGEIQNLIRTGSSSTSATAYKPYLPVSLTVGGQPAFIQSLGQTVGAYGLTQIRFTAPATVPTGVQPVVVTVNGVSSAPANITVQ